MSPVLHVLGDTHASGATGSEVAPTPCPTRLMTLAPSKVPLPAERIRGVRWSVRGPLRFSVLIYQSKSPPDSCILSSVGALQDEAAIRGCIRLADCMLQALGPDWFAMLRA